jgi:3,4-dihydroxy 2-butanone 4-phosphate synthase/GTP cyclohydrolase II
VDLARLAGLKPAGVICEIMKEDGTMARVPDLEKFSKKHDVKLVTVAQIIEYRHAYETQVTCAVETKLPTPFGEFRLRAYENEIDELTHVALVMGEPEGKGDVLVRVHSACLTGDALHSLRCDCGEQLEAAMERVAHEGEGVIVYMQQEGRGIGLLNKMKGLSPPGRRHGHRRGQPEARPRPGSQGLRGGCADPERSRPQAHPAPNQQPYEGRRASRLRAGDHAARPDRDRANGHNERYLKTKRERLNHVFEKF